MFDNFLNTLGIGSHEQSRDPERDSVIMQRLQEVEYNIHPLRNAIYAEDKAVVLEEDGLVQRAATAAVNNIVDMAAVRNQTEQEQSAVTHKQAADAAGTVINMAASRERRELSEKERLLAAARASTYAAYEAGREAA